jgi:hypothetical protein
MTRSLIQRLVLTSAVVFLAVVPVLASPPPGSAGGRARLPDLEQEVPGDLVVVAAGEADRPRYRLAFRSAVRNVGDGPLVIDGRRGSRDTAAMTADQVVIRRGAPRELVRGVGRLRFVVSPDHRHWHLLGFQRYELRRPGSSAAVVEDHKTGFCLGDRYAAVGPRLPERATPPVFTSRCGLGQDGLLGIREGISVGYGDDYAANLEGQFLPLDGLAGGRYVLVHQVNQDHRIRETRYGNNAASVLLSLHWRLGVPYLRVIARCAGSARCAARRP